MEHEEFTTAEECINETAAQTHGSPEAFRTALIASAESLEAVEKAQVLTYVSETRSALQGMTLNPLPAGIGGVYDGSTITMATSTMMVGESIDATVAQINETAEHEKYHQTNAHTEAMKIGSSADGEHVVTIGSEKLTDTRLVEALTVHMTGKEFVSAGYVEHERIVTSALVRAALTWDDVEQAVNEKKDLTLLDDADRQDAEKPELVMAA
jgi:hypothetical protein